MGPSPAELVLQPLWELWLLRHWQRGQDKRGTRHLLPYLSVFEHALPICPTRSSPHRTVHKHILGMGCRVDWVWCLPMPRPLTSAPNRSRSSR